MVTLKPESSWKNGKDDAGAVGGFVALQEDHTKQRSIKSAPQVAVRTMRPERGNSLKYFMGMTIYHFVLSSFLSAPTSKRPANS